MLSLIVGSTSMTTSASAATLSPPASVSVVVESSGTPFGQGRITATWSAVSGALGYAITARSGGVTVASATVSAPLTTGTISGLTGGISYDILIQTANSDGFGGTSAAVQATALTVPGAPAVGTPSTSGETTTVTWTEPNNGGSAISSYTITQSATGTVISNLTTTTYTFTGTTYTNTSDYSVTATNSVGVSASGEATSTTPSAPRSLQAVVTSGNLVATWQSPLSTGGAPITGYAATLSRGGSVVGSQSTTGLTTTFSGVTAGTYELQVNASNSNGSGLPASRSITVQADGSGATSGGGSSGGGPGGGGSSDAQGSSGTQTGSSAGESATQVITPGSSGGGVSPTVIASKVPSGVAPSRVKNKVGKKSSFLVTQVKNIALKRLVMRVVQAKKKPIVVKATFTRLGKKIKVTYSAPKKIGIYKAQILQRSGTGLLPVASTRLTVTR